MNYDILFDPKILKNYYDLQINQEVIKQRTSMWHDLRKKARVTGSTCYKGIGLGVLHEAQDHFDEYILKKSPKEISKDLQNKFDLGNKNEIHGIATICSILVPALLPANCTTWTITVQYK